MSVLDRIKAHGGRAELRSVEVPEWGDKDGPLVIYYRRPNLDHVAEAAAACPNSPVHQNLDVLVQIASNADGSPFFQEGQPGTPWRLQARLTLASEADPRVLSRIMREMGIIDAAGEAEQEKN